MHSFGYQFLSLGLFRAKRTVLGIITHLKDGCKYQKGYRGTFQQKIYNIFSVLPKKEAFPREGKKHGEPKLPMPTPALAVMHRL